MKYNLNILTSFLIRLQLIDQFKSQNIYLNLLKKFVKIFI